MPNKTVRIRTVLPIHIPLTINPGLNRRSASYRQQLLILQNAQPEFTGLEDEQAQEYESIGVDSWNNRIFIWQDVRAFPGLKVHAFPNNIAIAELELSLPYDGDHESLEALAQEKSKALMDKAYPQLIKSISLLVESDHRNYFSLKPEWMETLKVFWVARAILVRSSELMDAELQGLLKQWLSNTYRPEDADDIIIGKTKHSLTWLNYVLVDFEDNAPAANTDEKEQNVQAQGAGPHRRKKLSGGDDPRLDAMILAQYYYSAQEFCNQRLTESIDSAYNESSISAAQQQLSESRVVCRLHQVDYYEHLKYLTAPKQALLEEILGCWNYDSLKDNGQRMIDICSSRIDEVESKQRERSSVMTDLLLVALSFFTVFELSLYLMELSREMMSRPALSYTDEESSFFLELIAHVDTDIMFGAGFILTILLLVVYKIMKFR